MSGRTAVRTVLAAAALLVPAGSAAAMPADPIDTGAYVGPAVEPAAPITVDSGAGTLTVVLLAGGTLVAGVALWRGDFACALEELRAGEAVLVEADREDAARVLALGVRAQADAAEPGIVAPADAVVEADRLLDRLRRVVHDGDASLPEPELQPRQAEAERMRIDSDDDAAAWRDVAAGWDALSRPYEAAYARSSGWPGAPGSRCPASAPTPGCSRSSRAASARCSRSWPPAAPNRQIAGELFITDKTASVHVSNILGKLGVATRGEAAALAHRAGLDLEPVSFGA